MTHDDDDDVDDNDDDDWDDNDEDDDGETWILFKVYKNKNVFRLSLKIFNDIKL